MPGIDGLPGLFGLKGLQGRPGIPGMKVGHSAWIIMLIYKYFFVLALRLKLLLNVG